MNDRAVSFGVITALGAKDVTGMVATHPQQVITLIPGDHLIVSAKGDVVRVKGVHAIQKYAISPTDILAAVQNKSTPRFFSIYLRT